MIDIGQEEGKALANLLHTCDLEMALLGSQIRPRPNNRPIESLTSKDIGSFDGCP